MKKNKRKKNNQGFFVLFKRLSSIGNLSFVWCNVLFIIFSCLFTLKPKNQISMFIVEYYLYMYL